MKKERKIVMIPSKNPTNLYLSKGNLYLYPNVEFEHTINTGQHLYIISDDPINDGDWFINLGGTGGHPNPGIYRANSKNSKSINEFKFPEIKKIIATTDPELTTGGFNEYKLPLIPKNIIDAYVSKPFDSVMVDYDTEWKEHTKIWMEALGDDPDNFKKDPVLKTNADGTLAVSLIA